MLQLVNTQLCSFDAVVEFVFSDAEHSGPAHLAMNNDGEWHYSELLKNGITQSAQILELKG